MSKKVIIVFLLVNLFFYIYSIENKPINDDSTSDKTYNELFTLNIGIMKLKKSGSIQNINPLDVQNIENTIKNELDKIKLVKLSKKDCVVKSIDYYNIINEKKSSVSKDKVLFLRNKFFYNDKYDENLVFELFQEFRNDAALSVLAKKWFESLNNPFYSINITPPFDRKLYTEEDISQTVKVSSRFPLDMLITGEVERVDKLYFVTLLFYSNVSKSVIAEITYAADSENLNLKTIKELKAVFSRIFLINYASLSVNTNDEEVRIYIDSKYAGRKNIVLDYIQPGNYILTLKKENFTDKIENIKLYDYEIKEIKLGMDKKIELQIINFYIEPAGTKVFINSIYQGKTPFKKALPKGDYVISCKNDLYESYRYILTVGIIQEDELNVVFHLKSIDAKNYFKIKKAVYYASFWNFTFGLAVTVPMIIFANYAYNRFSLDIRNDVSGNSYQDTAYILMALSYIFGAYTVISLGWLFYALADYLMILEKKDFIPIIDFYRDNDSGSGFIIGANIKVRI